MNKKALSLAICMAMALPTATNALSLGEIESKSSLNQPFKGKIDLLSTSVAEAKNLRIRVASQDVFNRVGIDRPAFLNNIRFRTTVQNGKPVILVSSNQPINEPFLNFLLEISWPNGQLLKEYTVLLDPPVLMRPNTVIANNNAGIRAEPTAQGRINRPVAQQRQTAQQRRQAQLRRQAQQLQRQRQTASVTTQSSYRVKRGDTLSKVATKLGYSGIRKDQMMVALFEKNRKAFIKKNMNNLRAGVLIKRPSLQEARVLSSRAAKAQVIAQARAWKKARATTLANKGGSSKSARLEVVGNKQTVDQGSQSTGGSVADLNKQLGLISESLAAKQKENEELKSQVSELESLLRKKNRLITLKSDQLAALQATLSGQSAEAETPENTNSTEATIEPAVQNEGTDIQQEVANSQANENRVIVRTEKQPVVENTTPEPVIVEPVVTDPVKPEVVDSDSSSSTDFMAMLGSREALAIGGGSLLALIGGFLYMRRRKSKDGAIADLSADLDDALNSQETSQDADADADAEVDVTSVIGDSGIIDESEYAIHDEVQADEDISLDENSEVDDIIQEADVYIVYGLHDQAESEIKGAINSHPDNLALHTKLLENYKVAGDKTAFEEEVKVFMEIESDQKDKYWSEICEWGNELFPESTLFDSSTIKGAAGAAGVAMVAGTAVADDVAEDVTEALADDSLIDDLDKIDIDMDDEIENIDLDDILGENIESDTAEIEDGEIIDLDGFDLNTEIDIDESEFALDDSIDDLLDSSEVSGVADEIETDLSSTSLKLDLDSDDFDKIMPESHAYKATDNDDVAAEADKEDSEDNLLADYDGNLSFLDLDDDSEAIEETQIETKIDLAKAYIDMGDIEGARSTLEEVMEEGSEEQKRLAEELLHDHG